MEFRETLLAAQRNQQQKSSNNAYYKARFDPPKKEKVERPKDKLSENIQKFLAKKEQEERQKQLEAKRKRDELLAMRDTKAMNKIRKTLKVIKSANKSVLADAIDTENTAVTLEGPYQPDQDDYGYESQEAAAIYQKMMEKYSKIPEESKFPTNNRVQTKKDIEDTKERVKYALQHVDDPVPHKRRRRTNNNGEDKESSPTPSKSETDKKKDEKPKIRKPMPPPMDFNQLLKLAEQKKSEPIDTAVPKKIVSEGELERPMTKKQRKEYEEEMARKMRRQQEMEHKKVSKEMRPAQDRDKKPESSDRIPKLTDKIPTINKNSRSSSEIPKHNEKEKIDRETLQKLHRNKILKDKEKLEREKLDREKLEREKLERMKMKQYMDNKIAMDSKSRQNIPKESTRPEHKNGIELKSQNTYRIDKNSNDKKFVIPSKRGDTKYINGHSSQDKYVPKPIVKHEKDKAVMAKQKMLFGENGSSRLNDVKRSGPQVNHKNVPSKVRPENKVSSTVPSSSSKPKITNSFDFDKHMNSLNKAKKQNDSRRSDDPRRKPVQKRRVLDSEEDSDMDDFIDDGDEDLDYSKHIKEIFGYDKARYRDEDDDDRNMESNFAQQMREEYISKKIGIMEDLEDMKMEAMEKKRKAKKRRYIED